MSSSNANVSTLFTGAAESGIISPESMNVLMVPDLGAQIQAGLGIDVNLVEASEVLLVGMEPDDSGSIDAAGHAQVVRDGHNMVMDEVVSGSKQKDSALIYTRYLNGEILNAFIPIPQAVRMNAQNYDPQLGTPLNDNTVVFLGTIMAKTQEFADNGVHARSISLILTDGHDQHSHRFGPRDVAALVKDMLSQENHIVAAMGIDDGRTDFRKVFREMGLEDRWILTPANNASEIRAAFRLFSQSSKKASQGANSFSQVAIGGFSA